MFLVVKYLKQKRIHSIQIIKVLNQWSKVFHTKQLGVTTYNVVLEEHTMIQKVYSVLSIKCQFYKRITWFYLEPKQGLK